MLIINVICLIACSYFVAMDRTWSLAWWVSGIGVVMNMLAVLTILA